MPLVWVEDDPLLSAWLAESLAEDGWQVLAAQDRPSALALLERHALPAEQPCVALLDMGLPPRPARPDEGLLLLAQLLVRWPLMHAVVLTGQSENAVAQQAVHAGAFDFLAKPVSLAALRPALARAAWFARRQHELLAQGRVQLSVRAELSGGVREASDQVAEQMIRRVLAANGFNVTAAARSLGLEREQLYYHMKKFGIQRQPATAARAGEPDAGRTA
ncbi:regulatory Fis family protein [Melaminivora alkalimesophila]|uniref:Regulatory Fis family protein n=2 Tax=Melaminivora alkalimesophila TaxID=1165852 RepID=A0A317RHP9_9BURK|nr:regulatory Fis family protein [Melaminivora alkalimesophila]